MFFSHTQASFLDTWIRTHSSTMSGVLTDIHGDVAEFLSGGKGDVCH